MNSGLKFSSLSDQVYDHLRRQMHQGDLLPGSTINIGEIANQLGISKTPLRDALIHLELEGFVTILPRRGVKVNELTIEDVKNAYDAIGLTEGFIVRQCIDKITSAHIQQLESLNQQIREDIRRDNFSKLFKNNLAFHNIYLHVSTNEMLKRFILPIKHRLYDFPRQNFIKEWELRNCDEHDQFITYLKDGDAQRAASILQDTHWSFEVQKDYIFAFYNESAV
jgi:DNA-binding GntR family transcriptional regulator